MKKKIASPIVTNSKPAINTQKCMRAAWFLANIAGLPCSWTMITHCALPRGLNESARRKEQFLISISASLCDPHDHQRHCWHSASVTNDVVKLALVITWPRGHFGLQRLHRQNFNSDINFVAHVKSKVLHKQIIRHKRILPKLHLQSHTVFHKVRLIIAENRLLACGFDLFLLLFSRQGDGLPNQLCFASNPVAHVGFRSDPSSVSAG